MATQTLAQTRRPQQLSRHESPAVGIATPAETTLIPYFHGDTGVMTVAWGLKKSPFMLTYDGELTKMHQFGNRFGILGVGQDPDHHQSNGIIGSALNRQLKSGQEMGATLMRTVPYLRGAFSLIAKKGPELFVATDRDGQGDMFIGTLESGGFVASSDISVIETQDVVHIAELEPGTVGRIGANAVSCTRWAFQV